MIVNYTYCNLRSNHLNYFNDGFKIVKNELKKDKITTIYNIAQNGISLEKIFKEFKVA